MTKLFIFCVLASASAVLSGMEIQQGIAQKDFVEKLLADNGKLDGACFSLNPVQKYFLKAYFGDSSNPITIQRKGNVSVAMLAAPGKSGMVFACPDGGTFLKIHETKARCMQNRCSRDCATCENIAKALIEYPDLANMMIGLGCHRKFEYPDSRIFTGIIPGVESGSLPVSLHVSTAQFLWLMAEWVKGAFVPTRYSACVSSIKITDKYYNSVTLDRCCLSDPNSCCTIKRDGEVLVPCEKHAHEHIKKSTSNWWATIKGFAAAPFVRWQTRSVIKAAGVVLGYYYCDSLAELAKNPTPVIEKAQTFLAQTAAPRAMSMWAGIKSLFSR